MAADAALQRFRTGGRIGLPTLLVVAVWIGLWFTWPRVSEPRHHRHASAGRVAYGRVAEGLVMNPTLFATMSSVGFRAPESMPAGIGRVRSTLPVPRRRFLHAAPRPGGGAAGLLPEKDNRAAALAGLKGYRMAPVPDTLAVPATAPGLVVQTAGRLRALDFQPDSRALEGDVPAGPWQVRAWVEVDGKGRPVRVFIEQGSGVPRVDGRVERALRRGRARRGTAAWGRVSVSVGGRQ